MIYLNIIALIVIVKIALAVADDETNLPSNMRIKAGDLHAVSVEQSDKEPLVDDDDLVLSCGCICKYKRNSKYSQHVATIKCAECAEKEIQFQKSLRHFRGLK